MHRLKVNGQRKKNRLCQHQSEQSGSSYITFRQSWLWAVRAAWDKEGSGLRVALQEDAAALDGLAPIRQHQVSRHRRWGNSGGRIHFPTPTSERGGSRRQTVTKDTAGPDTTTWRSRCPPCPDSRTLVPQSHGTLTNTDSSWATKHASIR